MPSTGIDDLSPELLLIIASYLPPSEVLKFSIASEKAAFLQPDFDEVKINSNNMARGENYRTQVLDIEVTADVDEVLVTFETSGAQVFFGFDIKTWGNLPSSKRWQTRERGNLRIVFELQWETPLCDPLIATKLLF